MIEVSPKIETNQVRPLVFDLYGISAPVRYLLVQLGD